MEQGVAAHMWPFVVSTLAPGGVEVTSQAVLVPRVTVAQAGRVKTAQNAAAIFSIKGALQGFDSLTPP